jgi:hypothetical protein
LPLLLKSIPLFTLTSTFTAPTLPCSRSATLVITREDGGVIGA